MNNIAMTLVYKYPFKFLLLVPLCIYPEIELLNQMVVLFNFFDESPNCFLQWLQYFTLPSTMRKGFNFSIYLPTLLFCYFHFFYIHLAGCEVMFSWGFNLHFLND